jgi:hypothetical protein
MTFQGRRRVSPDYPYAEYDATGKDNRDNKGNRRWNSLIEMLTALVADGSRPADERGRAIEVLKFYAETLSSVVDYPWPEGTPQEIIDRDIAVAKMHGQLYVGLMWYTPEDCLIQDWPQTDGRSIHPSRSVMSRTYHDPTYEFYGVPKHRRGTLPAPAGLPAPVLTAVPLPVIAPSDVEQAAVKESSLTFDERFSPAAVAARVAKIEREAAAMARDQTE